MKTRLFIVFLILLSLNIKLEAQRQAFIPGIIVNPNGVSFEGDVENYWDGAGGKVWGGLGGSFGICVQYDITKNLYIRPELLFTRKGSIYEFNSEYATRAFETIFMYYVEAPVTFGLRVDFPTKQYLLESGFIVSKFISKNFSASEIFHREGTSISQDFNNIDLMWSGSLKWCINPKNKKNILFGLKVLHSIIPINKTCKIYHFDYGIELVYFLI